MDPIVESNWLFRWQGIDALPDESADPSLRQMEEARLRASLLFQSQREETDAFLKRQAVGLVAALVERKGEVRFFLPEEVVGAEDGAGGKRAVEVPAEFHEQRIAGFLNRIPVKDIRLALRRRLSQLENSGYTGVRLSAELMRFAIVREIVAGIDPEETGVGLPAGAVGPDNLQTDWEKLRTGDLQADPAEQACIRNSEAAIVRLRAAMNTLHQAVSLAPYMYADEEYQGRRRAILTRAVTLGHLAAHYEMRDLVRTVWRRARADDLNRGLSLSVPYFDDRTLEMGWYDFEVIPLGRTMFVPAFVVLAAVREQEKIEQQKSLSVSTRLHLFAELKNLEQAFDFRSR